MFYRINENIAVRSWKRSPYAYYERYVPTAGRLTKEAYELLSLCDGEHDLPEDDPLLQNLLEQGFLERCSKGEHPSSWSMPKQYDHRYFPRMNLMITGKCNYNCRHCFNAADNAALMSEWSFEELIDLLDQAKDCGIHAVTITGGEPMRHPRFEDILREIHQRDMFVEELNTNGSFITSEVLKRMKSFGCRPLMKISLDGLESHDWMRAQKGAKERTLSAVQLCIEHGFQVKIQTQVNKKTLDSLLAMLTLVESMGVSETRLIRTTETGRWALNAGEMSLSIEEYYEEMLKLASQYCKVCHHMSLDIWQFLRIDPKEHIVETIPEIYTGGNYRDSAPVCKGNRGMIGVTSDGDVVPCLQMSGLLLKYGISMGNLHTVRLKELLSEGTYVDTICHTLSELRQANPKCGSCPWFRHCTGGCRALGLLFSGDALNWDYQDSSKCMFFEHGWYDRVLNEFSDWNLKRID